MFLPVWKFPFFFDFTRPGSDCSIEWATADRDNAIIEWNHGTTRHLHYHRFSRQTQLLWSEVSINNNADQTEFGNWYYATKNGAGVTWQSGSDFDVRNAFVSNKKLGNTQDANFRPASNRYPVFGLAVDRGSVTTSASALFTINLVQDEPVQFKGANNETSALPGLWKSYFPSETASLDFFYMDFATVSPLCDSLDNKIVTDTMKYGGSNYSAFAQLAVRQAFGGLAFVNTTANPIVFLKEISSDGNVNTADVIFPFFPIALYLNANIIKWLLEPLFIQQEGGDWLAGYAEHDIGAHYPNGTLDGYGPGGQEPQQVEESGNMIIMAVAYAKAAKDTAYLQKHYPKLKQWASYLLTDGQFPGNQLSTDDFQGRAANQTNLALKAVSGLGAISQAATLLGKTADSTKYRNAAQQFVYTIQRYGTTTTGGNHTKLSYNDDPTTFTYSTTYNTWPDRALGSNIIPQSLLTNNAAFYAKHFDAYGLPLDSRDNSVKSDWLMWEAAVSGSASVKKMAVDGIYAFITHTNIAPPFSDLYDATTAEFANGFFVARPVQGGLFAPLAMSQASGKVA